MKKWAFVFYIAMLAASCNSILSSRPSGTLSEEQMTDLLVDIHLTEATLRIANDSIARLNDTTDMRTRFAEVFRKNDVDPDDFNISLKYYLEHIEVLDKIYTEVISRLSEMEANLMQKTTNPVSDKMNRTSKLQQISPVNNPWFRTLYKPGQKLPVRYFSPEVYPVSMEE